MEVNSMKNSKVITEDEQKQLALFRFSVIAPVVNNTHAFSSKMAFFRDASLKKYALPSGEQCSFNASTIKKWYTDYMRYGFDSLKPKTRNDMGHSRKLSNEVASKIIELKQQLPHITGKAIYDRLLKDGTILAKDCSIATVYRYLNKHNLKYIPTVERKQFEMEHAGDCWQADTSHGPVIKIDGKKVNTYLVQIIDDASRLIVGCRFFLNDNALNFQAVLKQAIKTYGIPKRIFVDNGTPYKNLQLETICATLGTVLIHAKAYSPESKGYGTKIIMGHFFNKC